LFAPEVSYGKSVVLGTQAFPARLTLPEKAITPEDCRETLAEEVMNSYVATHILGEHGACSQTIHPHCYRIPKRN
jgi:hypothetical protein